MTTHHGLEVLTRRFDEYYKNPDENEGFGKLPDPYPA